MKSAIRPRLAIGVAAIAVLAAAAVGYLEWRDHGCAEECARSGYSTGAAMLTRGGSLGIAAECGCGPYRK